MALQTKDHNMWYVYILLCGQQIYYVGSTDNLERRFRQHCNKESAYTKKFADIKLLYSEKLNSHLEAVKRERQIKRWSVAKKKALILGDIYRLKQLSKGRGFVE